jgi:hypothetical protein
MAGAPDWDGIGEGRARLVSVGAAAAWCRDLAVSVLLSLYEWTAQVRVGGRTVDAIPLFYQGVGNVGSDKPFVKPVTANCATGAAVV